MSENSSPIDENVISFYTESREMIEEVEPRLIEMSQSSSNEVAVDPETTNLIFRLFHSIKGTAGFLQYHEVVRVTHEAETLLDLIRSGQVQVNQQNIDVLCRACDMVNTFLDQIEATGSDSGLESDALAIVEELKQHIHQEKTTQAETIERTEPGKPEKHVSEANDGTPKEEGAPKTVEDSLLTREMNQRFIEEAFEQLEQVEESLLQFKEEQENREHIQEAFRSLHSFKGNCGFLGYPDLEELGHKTETAMEAIKERLLRPDDSTIQTLLHIVDVLNQSIQDISSQGHGKIQNKSVLLDLLDDILAEAKLEATEAEQRPAIEQPEAVYLLREDTPLPGTAQEPADTSPKKQDKIKVPAVSPSLKRRTNIRQDLRVSLTKLDQLVNLVGELVIAESMVTRNPDLKGYEFENFERASNQLNKIVRDIQDMTLSVRMIPIAGVFRKMIRLVHDLSAKVNKKINLKLSGEDTEIDKTVSELIADPLVHLVRNSIDHGIEPPDERIAADKDETGEILLEAKHEGGEMCISIIDDGRGLDREKILNKAIAQGIIADDKDMTDEDIFQLIFHPGFSTADKVTDVSGRGVGMDVVKTNIEKIKGSIDIRSEAGQGSTVALRIPLTMAIIDGMMVRVGKALYTIPLLGIRESVQVDKADITETMDGQELIRVREELLPVVRLYEIHDVTPDNTDLHEGLVVIVEHGGSSAGLLIDEILGEQQAVIKGLSNYVGNIKGVSGCTILGDGDISLILDTGGLIKRAMQDKVAA